MAADEEDAVYESDPEDALLSLAMRRREASDDEEGEGSDAGGKPERQYPRTGIGYDGDSDWQGGAPEDEDEEFDVEEEEEKEEEELDEAAVIEERASDGGGDVGSVRDAENTMASERDGQRAGGEPVVYQGKNPVEEVEEDNKKKEKEPYAVPTAGAFYMHDDRFQENGRGRHRRMPGGRKLWESKDDRAWVHDMFEEMNLQDTLYDGGRRTSKGRFRGHGNGKTGANDGGYGRGNRSQAYSDHGNNQNHASKFVRGRGPRRYEPVPKNKSVVPETQHNLSANPLEGTSNSTVGRQSSQTLNVQPDPILSRKHVFASSLSSASPPFYPSGSSSQDTSVTRKRNTNKSLSSSMQTKDYFPASQSGSFLRGKMIVDSVGVGGQYIDASLPPVAGKTLVNRKLQSSGSAMSLRSTTPSYSGILGRGVNITALPNYPQASSHHQVARVSSQIHPPVVQQRPAPTVIQPALRSFTQKLGQRPGSGYQVSSSPRSLSTNSSEFGETDSPSGSIKSKTLLVGKGKTSNEGSRDSVLYNGAQVNGAARVVGVSQRDQSFPATPTLLPVMHFAGQNHDGRGVPAIGMALPGYVAQPQLGFGNSEMTWMPVLAGASGALGASYCSPYITLDSSCYAHPSGMTSSSVASNETTTTKPATMWKPPQRPEIVNDEFGQRQNKPRRYSAMNFGQ